MVKLAELEAPALEMVLIYKDHSRTVQVSAPDGSTVTESYCTDLGMDKLADRFNNVHISNRVGVFSIFLDKLQEEGLGADFEQFKGTVH